MHARPGNDFPVAGQGEPEPKEQFDPFTDVEAGGYYEKAVLWAVEQGVTEGTSAEFFSPDDLCTYAQIITFLWRACGRPEMNWPTDMTKDWPDSWYKDAVTWADRNALLEDEVGRFDPETSCSRARTMVWLYRDAIVYASDVIQLMEAVGSGREIYLSPGTYDLSEWIEYIMEGQPWDTGNPAVTLTQVDDGWGIQIQDVQNLTIAAQPGAEGTVAFTVEPRYANVLSFLNCDGVTIDGLTMGHETEQGAGQGAALHFDGCGAVSLNTLDLYGSAYGLTAENVSGISAAGVLIRDCSRGAMTLSDVWNATFNGCVFRDCGEFTTLEIMSSAVEFAGSTFSGNAGTQEGGFLYTDSASSVSFLGCTLDDASREAVAGHPLYGQNVFLS